MNRKSLKLHRLICAFVIFCCAGIVGAQEQLLISLDKEVKIVTVNKVKKSIEDKYKISLRMIKQRATSGSFLFQIQGNLSVFQKSEIEKQFSTKGVKIVVTSSQSNSYNSQLSKRVKSNRKPVK